MHCKNCDSNKNVVKNGKSKDGVQTYLCKKCKQRFVGIKKLNRIAKEGGRKKVKEKLFLKFYDIVKKNNLTVPPFKEISLDISRQTYHRWSKELEKKGEVIEKRKFTLDISEFTERLMKIRDKLRS